MKKLGDRGSALNEKRVHGGACPLAPLFVAFVAAALHLWMAPHEALAVTPALLIDRQLQKHTVKIQSIDEGMMSFFDHARELRVDPLDQYVQIYPLVEDLNGGGGSRGGPENGWVELVDRQRLSGRWVGGSQDGQTLYWDNESLGRVSIPLTRIRSITLVGDPVGVIGDPPTPRDTLRFKNGDQIEGFVTAIEADGIELRAEGHREPIRLPLDRLAAVRLSNPSEPGSGSGYEIEFMDGSVVQARWVRLDSDRWFISPGLTTGTGSEPVPIDRLKRVVPSGAGSVTVPLGDLPMRVLDGGDVFGVESPPQLASTTLRLHAPVRVELELPEAATRFGCTVRLAAGDGALSEPWGWADCPVTFYVDQEEVAAVRLNADRLEAEINVAIHGGVLIVVVEEGANGPVMDRVVLDNAMVLISQADEDNRSNLGPAPRGGRVTAPEEDVPGPAPRP